MTVFLFVSLRQYVDIHLKKTRVSKPRLQFHRQSFRIFGQQEAAFQGSPLSHIKSLTYDHLRTV